MKRLAAFAMVVVMQALAPAMTSSAAGQEASAAPYITPYDAIWRAAADPSRGVKGTFKLTVKAWGVQDGIVYLNSEKDYRDPRSISIDLLPDAQSGMTKKFGSPAALVGRTIVVTGTAKRVTIWFFSNGKQSQKYYFQTHVEVTSARQIDALAS